MKKVKISWMFFSLLFSIAVVAQKNKSFQLQSPDRNISIKVEFGDKLQWSVSYQSQSIISPSTISLQLQSGEALGEKATIISSKIENINSTFKAINYKKAIISDVYNQLSLICKGDYTIIFRAYNDGVAYRFITKKKDQVIVQNEETNFNFDKDYTCYVPYVNGLRGHEKFIQSFEALYDEVNISHFAKDTLAFLPVLIDYGNNVKAVLLEADLEEYPGMYLKQNDNNGISLKGVYAQYPIEEMQGGYRKLNTMVTKRADYIAKVNGVNNFPWRAIVISNNDAALLNNDMVQKLAAPSRIADVSWIKPGKVAWDWWNDWNISHVDFKAGINTETYKYYIDFAAANKLEYIVMDEGWSNSLDLMDLSSKINLQEIIDYGKQKNVEVILWATWYAVKEKMKEAFSKYAAIGVKGFKIDFMDRDDQRMVASLYEIAKVAAEYKLVVDYHGMYKPTGLQRTYPNVLNFEGVKGAENLKWSAYDDVPHYNVTIPFIRMVAGPMDYTPGAMRNATKKGFVPNNSMPMSQGTRCQQLAMYVVFEAPIQMLSDNPTVYIKEQESTDFIAKVPTTFDETVALVGKVGEYAAIARRKGDTWFVGAMSNWKPKDIILDFSFLGEGMYEAVVFKDGINADKDATDYKREIVKVSSSEKLTIHLSNGGGWAARIYKLK